MSNIFIFHGSYGYPDENWFPWLKNELEKLGHKVIVPAFPTPEGQELSNWNKVLEQYLPEINNETILIGHSCGAAFTLRILEQINVRINAAFLVAGPVHPLGNDFDKVHMSFIDHPFNWVKIRSNCENFYPIYSLDDPYIQLDNGEITSKELNSPLILFEKAGHFNTKAGFNKFDYLFKLITGIIK